MTFAQAVESAFRNYANFNGRARRSEYWYFILLNGLVSLLGATPLFPLVGLYSLAVLVPSLAAGARRLHDTGRSGLWLLLLLIPLVGEIILIVWMCEDSKPGPNQYGPDPKGRGAGFSGWPSQAGELFVRCVSGPIQGQIYRVGHAGLMFGRDPACAVHMPDGTPGVSARHCVLRIDRGVLVLEDLQSTYGTFLASGKRLPPNYPEHVSVGARFYLGGPDVMFQVVNQ